MDTQERLLDTPGTFTLAGNNITGNVSVTFRGRSLDGGFWDRVKFCFDLLFRPSRVRRAHSCSTMIVSNFITVQSDAEAAGISLVKE